MKNKIFKGLIFLVVLSFCIQCSIAENSDLKNGISDYKEKNYVGCIQKMSRILYTEPENVVAMYYKALSQTQIGKEKEAAVLFEKIVKLDMVDSLTTLSKKALICIEDSDACVVQDNKSDEAIQNLFYSKELFASEQARPTVKQIDLNVNSNTYNRYLQDELEHLVNDEAKKKQ